MANASKQLNLLIMKFMDYLIQESGYYVTEKPKIKRTDNRKIGYRAHTKSVGDNRLKALNWGFQLIQVSREEMKNYAERYIIGLESSSAKMHVNAYREQLQIFIDNFIEEYFVFQRADTRQREDIYKSYRTVSSNEKLPTPSKYEMRFETVQPSRADFEKHISFFLSTTKP
jgi:hypothetical protein